MSDLEFKLEGADKLSERLQSLGDKKKLRSHARRAGRKGMQLVQFAASVGASRIDDPDTRESIQENIAIRNKKSRDLNSVVVSVGVLGGAKQYAHTKSNVRKRLAGTTYATDGDSKNPGGNTWYWRFIEFGTAHSPAIPFLEPALKQNTQAVTNEVIKAMSKSIESAVKRGKLE